MAKRPGNEYQAKIGTHPGTIVRIKGSPKLRVGLRIRFREWKPRCPWANLTWEPGRIAAIDMDGDRVWRVFIDR